MTGVCFLSSGFGVGRDGMHGVRRVCTRPVRMSVDSEWDSWAMYREEMREKLEQKRAAAGPVEIDEVNTTTFTSGNSANGSIGFEVPSPIFDGAGIRFDFTEGIHGDTSQSEWFAEKQQVYAEWESNRGYFKRTKYSFRDEILYEEVDEKRDAGAWQTKFDYSSFAGTDQGPKKARRKTKTRKAQRKRIDIDLFQVLGIAKASTSSEIKAAYRSLARRYHPDANPNNAAAAEKMSIITFAYTILKDPTTRTKYERGDL